MITFIMSSLGSYLFVYVRYIIDADMQRCSDLKLARVIYNVQLFQNFGNNSYNARLILEKKNRSN